MKKLKLQADALRVETFHPAPDAGARPGTVAGREADASVYRTCQYPTYCEYFTCEGRTCVYGPTCGMDTCVEDC